MNKYELTVVVDGKAGSAKKKKVTETVDALVETFKGKVIEAKDWGMKDLTYKIKKSTSGLFLFFELELDGSGIKALNDRLRMDGEVLRHLIVKNG